MNTNDHITYHAVVPLEPTDVNKTVGPYSRDGF